MSIPGEISEEESDKCMGEMVGTNLDEEQPCGISEACIKTMTTRGFIEYSITHQLLWTMLAQKVREGPHRILIIKIINTMTTRGS